MGKDIFKTEKDRINALLSLQNGITLDLSAQNLFDTYAIAVDVDVCHSYFEFVANILIFLVQDDYRLYELSSATYLNLKKMPKLVRNMDMPPESQLSRELLRTHFVQALLENVLGDGLTSERAHRKWLRERDRLYFGEKVDLSNKMWISDVGKDIFERYLLMHLYGCLTEVEGEDTSGRWSSTRRNISKELHFETPPEQDWPDKFDIPSEFSLYVTESNPEGYPFHPHWYKFLFAE